MSRYWSEGVAALTPYVPGEQPKLARLVKLNTNECPYPPSPRVLAALRAEADDALRLYPDPACERLLEAIAAYHGLEPAQVFVGNGSDEVLAHTFRALLKHAQPVLFPDITYSFYPVYCKLYGISCVQVPLNAAFEIRVDDYLRANGGIVFPNPNAPTGCALALSEIERLLQANRDSVVVVDEAYADFGAPSAVGLIARYPQLLTVHTLSKSRALAGLRVGYALGDAALIAGLRRVKDSFNSYPLGRYAQVGATAAMEDRSWFEENRAKVIASRDALDASLRGLGFEVLPSKANFVFARHPQHDAAALAAALRARGVIVRHFAQPERIAQFLRISVGTDEQCRILIGELEAILA